MRAMEIYCLIRKFGPLPYTFSTQFKEFDETGHPGPFVKDGEAFVERLLDRKNFFSQHIYDPQYSLWVRARPTNKEINLLQSFKAVDKHVSDETIPMSSGF